MSLIEAISEYIKSYSALKAGAPVWVDYLGHEPTEYSIIPLTGSIILEEYIDGSSLREFPFAFQSVESTVDNIQRLDNVGFFEAFADWLEYQTEAGVLPELADNQQAEEIEALGRVHLFRQGESGTGIYQIQCRLVYEQKALALEAEEE